MDFNNKCQGNKNIKSSQKGNKPENQNDVIKRYGKYATSSPAKNKNRILKAF